MREFKFRAWHIKNKSMCFFDFEKMKKDVYQMGHFMSLLNGDYGDVLMQYTGLKDKFGIEIFEGDIIYVEYNYLGSMPVVFKQGSFNILKYDIKRCKVIGNIHENPELLKET